jgi:hypothetical protein
VTITTGGHRNQLPGRDNITMMMSVCIASQNRRQTRGRFCIRLTSIHPWAAGLGRQRGDDDDGIVRIVTARRDSRLSQHP